MTAAAAKYDLFVIHADADREVVRGDLLPRLGIAPDRVRFSDELPLGAPQVGELARAVAESKTTLVVLSPAYLLDRWAAFGEQLAGHKAGVDAGLIPIFLEDCELPLALDFRIALDLRDRARWDDQLARLRRDLALPAPAPLALTCPYPGLDAFSKDTAARFFGREKELRDLLEDIANGCRELFVVGPSGSGKSSLLAAGAVPSLERLRPPFQVCSFRPGPTPSTALRNARVALPVADTRVAIVIDQLEEMFTQADADERGRFTAALRELRADPRVLLLYALRDDFYGHLIASELGADCGPRPSQINVLPLCGDALRTAIRAPLAHVAIDGNDNGTAVCYADPRLVEALVEDASGEPSPLPLVQKALEQVWRERRNRLLPFEPYDRLRGDDAPGKGRLAGAFARWADARIAILGAGGELIARRILIRLVTIGADGRVSRRSRTVRELRRFDRDRKSFDDVLEALIDDRLIAAHDDDASKPGVELDDRRTIELAHEALITAWQTYAAWIKEDADAADKSQRFEERAAYWVKRGRDLGGLFDDVHCKDAEAWLATPAATAFGVSDDLARFVAKSRGFVTFKRRIVTTGVIAIALAAAVIAVVALRLRRTTVDLRAQTATAQAQAKAAEADRWIDLDPGRAAHLLYDAMDLDDSAPTRRIVDRWLRRRTLAALPTDSGFYTDADWLNDETIVTTAGENGVAIWTRTDDGWHVQGPLMTAEGVTGIEANAASQRFAFMTSATVEVRDRKHDRSWSLDVNANRVSFSPDGNHLVCVGDGLLTIVDLQDDRLPRTTMAWAAGASSVAVDDTTLLLGSPRIGARRFDGTAVEVATLPTSPVGTSVTRVLGGFLTSDGVRGVYRLALGAKGLEATLLTSNGAKTLAGHQDNVAALSDGNLTFFSSQTGDTTALPAFIPGDCPGLSWSPDGTRVAVACRDGLVRIVSVERPSGAIRGAKVSDGETPRSIDGTLLRGNKPTDRRVYAVALAPPPGTPGAWGPDVLRLYDAHDNVLAAHSFAGHSDRDVVWAPSGEWLAHTMQDQIEILDGDRLEPVIDPIASNPRALEAISNDAVEFRDYRSHWTVRVRSSAQLKDELRRYLAWSCSAEQIVSKQ